MTRTNAHIPVFHLQSDGTPGARSVRIRRRFRSIVRDAVALRISRAEPSLMGMPNAAERWTADLVRALPDDGMRYELVSGQLVVTPSPRYAHQRAISELEAILRAGVTVTAHAGPSRLYVVHSPADVSLGEDEVLQPDLFVHRTATGRPAEQWSEVTALLLVIEVLSPATARNDRYLKRLRYQRAGVPEYWVVDLDARLIERWRPADERPEILTELISWQPEGSDAGVEVDLPGFFVTVLGS